MAENEVVAGSGQAARRFLYGNAALMQIARELESQFVAKYKYNKLSKEATGVLHGRIIEDCYEERIKVQNVVIAASNFELLLGHLLLGFNGAKTVVQTFKLGPAVKILKILKYSSSRVEEATVRMDAAASQASWAVFSCHFWLAWGECIEL
ncbi:hypothetical protein BDN72DRAFT_858286 [Pluteus cervinus]|uniref:Uncharacterized protein n=1 Tax=Pluteus cervinus TaxID=181527 RepID=A0ACD3AUE0_9AGAR|nr:hypothetical protein BDN72DRAFT_858286 [Pluteus cervinus]